ncbi:hypothetical protein Tco_1312816, partial [Tanacetum coccineum]
DETLMIQGNRSDGYASIVACKQRVELFGRIANVTTDALSKKERAKPLRVGDLVMTINSNLPPQIHEAQVEALKKENVKDENLHVLPMARHGSRRRHLYQQVLDVFKDEGRLSKAIWFTGTTRNTLLEIGKYSHGFYHKSAKDNKLLLHDLGNHDHQKNYADVRRKPLEFQVGGISVERSDTFWQTRKAEPTL